MMNVAIATPLFPAGREASMTASIGQEAGGSER